MLENKKVRRGLQGVFAASVIGLAGLTFTGQSYACGVEYGNSSQIQIMGWTLPGWLQPDRCDRTTPKACCK